MATAGDVVWIDVLPAMDKFLPAMRAQLGGAVGVSQQQGRAAGAAFGAGFGTASAASVEAAATKVAAASKRAADAQGALSVAQTRLTELHNAGAVSATRMATAEEAVAKAQRNVQLQTDNLGRAEAVEARVKTESAAAANAAGAGMGTLSTRMGVASGAARVLQGAMGLATKAMTLAFTLSLPALPIVGAIKSAADFNAAMVRIQTQAGATRGEIQRFTPALLTMASKEVAQSPEALATSLYHVYSTGLRGAEALNVVAGAAKFATVAHADLEETTNALTATVASGIGGFKNMDGAIAALNTTVGVGDMKLSDLNEALGSGLLARVKLFGVNIVDVGAALATFGDNNVRGADAATMLRTAVEALAVPARGGQKVLERLGISAGQLARDMQEGGLNKAITDLHDHLIAAGISGDQTGAIITQAFGKKAGGGVALLLGQYDRLQTKYADINSAQQSFTAEWDATTKTAAFAFDSLRSTVEVLGIRIGEALLPVLATAARALGGFLNQVMEGTGPAGALGNAFTALGGILRDLLTAVGPAVGLLFRGLWDVVGGLVTVLAALLGWVQRNETVLRVIAEVVGVLATGVLVLTADIWLVQLATTAWALATGGVSVALGVLRGAWVALQILFAASPVGLIITALVALGVVFYEVYQHSEAFRNAIQALWDALKVGFAWVQSHWQLLLGALSPPLLGVVELIRNWGAVWSAVTGAIETGASAFAGFWVGLWSGVVSVFNTAWGGVRAAATTVWSALTAAFAVLRDAIATAWNAVAGVIQSVWVTVIQPVWNAMKIAAELLVLVVGTLLVGPVLIAWNLLSAGMRAVWTGVIQPLWNAIAAGASWLWNVGIKPELDAILAGWQATWGVVSAVFGAVWGAISAAAHAVWTALAGFFSAAWAAYSAAWTNFWTGVQRVFQTIWSALSGWAQAAWSALSGWFAAQWAAFSGAWNNFWTGVFTFYRGLWDALTAWARATWSALAGWFAGVWAAFSAAWTGFWNSVFGFFRTLWTTLSDWVKNLWNATFGAWFGAAWAAFTGAWNGFWTGVRNIAQGVWNTIKAAAEATWNAISSTAQRIWNAMAGALSAIWNGIVRTASDTWNRIKAVVRAPIAFVVETVLRDGLAKAWNWISDHILGGALHIDTSIFTVPALAAGGQVPGWSPHDQADNIPAMLTAKEFVQPVAAVDRYGVGFMEAVRTGAFPEELAQHYATGGYTYPAIQNWILGNIPGAIITSTLRPGAADFHGKGEAVDFSFPGNPQSRLEPAAAQVARHWPNMTEGIHNPNLSVKYGKNVAPSFWGAGTWAEHQNHVHVAMTPAALAGGVDAGGAASGGVLGTIIGWLGKAWSSVSNIAGDFLGSITGPLATYGKQFTSPFAQLIGKVPGVLAGKLWDSISSRVGDWFNSLISVQAPTNEGGSAPADVVGNQAVSATVRSVLAANGWGSGAEWAATNYIVSHESGWNPTAQNPTSSASGLFQFIDGTWVAVRPPAATGYPRAKFAPVNLQAMGFANYVRGRYGDPIGAQRYWAAHGNYDAGGHLPPHSGGFNDTNDVERVLTPQQTRSFDRLVDILDAGGGAGGALVGSMSIQMAEADPRIVADEIIHRLRVANRGGVFAASAARGG